jgi:predicted RNase H-like HicB family nuclease
MTYKINIVFEKDEHGYYVYAPKLPGCHSQGDTFEEAHQNIKEAIELYLETIDIDEKRGILSSDILTTTMEVEIA